MGRRGVLSHTSTPWTSCRATCMESSLAPGASGELSLILEPGTYFVNDPADGHHNAGANRRLTVVGGA
jgi:uncharacterized cupredoxin-like copper-binding protein